MASDSGELEGMAIPDLHNAVTGSASPHLGDTETLTLHLSHHGQTIPLILAADATLSDLSDLVAVDLSIPPSNQKFLLPPPHGLQRPPFKTAAAANLAAATLAASPKPIKLLGDPSATHEQLNESLARVEAIRARRANPVIKPAKPSRTRPSATRAAQDAQYTFHLIRPLSTLPDPEASAAMLRRLADDAGIRTAMRTHRFSVGLLTEMDPAMHTTHESRTLGLNRNRGEVIELRLRTDDDRGYRDYRTIRRTLCHELAHNVWGEHDANFWNLCRQIEREVARNDYRSGGRSLGDQEYAPERPGAGDDEDEHVDGGGWTGGEFRLGGGGTLQTATGMATSSASGTTLSRREILARAAEERARAARAAQDESEPDRSAES